MQASYFTFFLLYIEMFILTMVVTSFEKRNI